MQVKYVEVFFGDMANLGMSRKEVIQVISDIGQENLYIQAENHLDLIIRKNWLPNMKRLGRVIKSQTTATELFQICVSQQYR